MTDTQCRDCGRVYDDLTAVELASMAANRGCPSDDCPQREADYRLTLAHALRLAGERAALANYRATHAAALPDAD